MVVATVYISIILSFSLLGGGNDLPKELSLRWNAVFLSDGQVYFGHLKNENKEFVRLTDVYYLKSGSNLQQDVAGSKETSSQNLNLVKLGGEVHGPENSMFIARDKILFIENLKDTSTIIQAISKVR